MRRPRLRTAVSLPALVVLVLALGGCSADGTSNGDTAFEHDGVPFTFTVPADFTDEEVDEGNTRGNVVAVRALDKVNVVAVRRLTTAPRNATRQLSVLGKHVTSVLYPVDGASGWALECQYTPDRRDKVVAACDVARRTLTPR
jgi:hypothetical protein